MTLHALRVQSHDVLSWHNAQKVHVAIWSVLGSDVLSVSPMSSLWVLGHVWKQIWALLPYCEPYSCIFGCCGSCECCSLCFKTLGMVAAVHYPEVWSNVLRHNQMYQWPYPGSGCHGRVDPCQVPWLDQLFGFLGTQRGGVSRYPTIKELDPNINSRYDL